MEYFAIWVLNKMIADELSVIRWRIGNMRILCKL